MMEVSDLRNYGKPLKIPDCVPKRVQKQINKESLKIIRKNIGLISFIRLMFLMMRENWRMSKHDMSVVRERGLCDKNFLKGQIQMAAFFTALSKIVGKEKALEIFNEIMDTVGTAAMGAFLPEPEDLKKLSDPFGAFRKYFMAFMAVDKEEGIHDFEVIEDTEDAIQINVTYCAYCEIPKQLGVVEACIPNCYADDVFFPNFCEKMGMRFIRKGTLARGDDVCDFRFERVNRH
jgi:hypothetical protein